uniref:THH1/TOM1/TOM3 domain-containing protein n=1 Tax=Kalanchoe fedtschenkoi TaxID=63787 RepID=A0A7N0TKR6_KALFE
MLHFPGLLLFVGIMLNPAGYFLYFVLSLVSAGKGWLYWSSYCGFIFMAFPEILFLSGFLLLLSFWVDLCHQAAGKEDEDEDEEASFHETLLQKKFNKSNPLSTGSQRKCCSLRRLSQVQSRQKIVILVTSMIIILMIICSVLIWMGNKYNYYDSSMVARVYVDFFAAINFLLGGALACYGLLLFMKMSKVRSERASCEMWKVAGLAIVSVFCFTSRALVAILTDTAILYNCQMSVNSLHSSIFLTIYYFLGSSVPSSFVLWVMRELPASPVANMHEDSRISTFANASPIVRIQPQQWTTSANLQNQVTLFFFFHFWTTF